MRKLLPVLLMFAPLPAYADGAPASVDADYSPVRIEFNTDVKSSPIDVRKHRLEVKTGLGTNSALGTTGRLQGTAEQKFGIPYLNIGDGLIGAGISMGASAKADLGRATGDAKPQLQNLDARALGFSPLVLATDDRRMGQAVVDRTNRGAVVAGECTSTSDLSFPCVEHLPPAMKKQFVAELRSQRQASLQECGKQRGEEACTAEWNQREAELVRVRALAWFDQRKATGNPLYLESDRVSPYEKPSQTGSLKLVNAQLVYRDQKPLGASAKGVQLDLFDLSGHVAFKVNGLPIDLCGQASLGYVLGAVETLGRERPRATEWAAHGCAGVQLGQVGRLGYDYRIGARSSGSGDAHVSDGPAWVVNQSHEVSLRKIAGTPISVTGSIETSHARTPDLHNRDDSVIKAGAARDTSAKFVTFGAEF